MDEGGNHRFAKRLNWYSFSGETVGLDARLVCFARLHVVVFVFVFFAAGKSRDDYSIKS